MIIQIIGLPGSGKTELAKALKERINAIHLNADEVRATVNSDLGFSPEDRIEQARRMGDMARLIAKQGVAPVIVDPEKDEVYLTPLYYTMAHFSKYIRPQAEIIEVKKSDEDLMVTAAKNTDGSIAVVIFNEGTTQKSFQLSLGSEVTTISINAQAIQTILINTI